MNEKIVSLLLRLGLAFSFIYVAISSFLNPNNWIGFFPSFLVSIIDTNILLTIFSIYEIILGVWLLTNRKIYYASILSAITLFGIIIFNLGALDIIFRDIPILIMAIILILMNRE